MNTVHIVVQQDIDPIDFLVRLARAPDPGAVRLSA
jgi:hypothetical protein